MLNTNDAFPVHQQVFIHVYSIMVKVFHVLQILQPPNWKFLLFQFMLVTRKCLENESFWAKGDYGSETHFEVVP